MRSERPRDAQLILGDASGTIYASPDWPDMLQVYARIRPPGQSNLAWTLIDVQSLDTILGELRRTRAVILSVAAIALILSIAAAVLLTRGIVRPVGALARAAQAIDQGQLDAALPAAERPDEVGVLTQSFAQMAGRVRTLVSTLRERVDELERSDAAQRAGEARLRQMIDTNLAGIAYVDVRTGDVLEANDAFLRIVGYDRDDLRAGRISRDVISPPSTARSRGGRSTKHASAALARRTKRNTCARTAAVCRCCSVWRWSKARCTRQSRSCSTRPRRKQAEAEQQARVEAAKRRTAPRASSWRSMSHELRTPLNAILGFAQILQLRPGPDASAAAPGSHAIQTERRAPAAR